MAFAAIVDSLVGVFTIVVAVVVAGYGLTGDFFFFLLLMLLLLMMMMML